MPGQKSGPKTKRVRFLYHHPEDVKPLYINGVYGGMTPRGELLCHFFYEYSDSPAEESAPVKNGRIDSKKIERKERTECEGNEKILRRDIRVSLIIPVQQIQSVSEWMANKLEESHIVVERETKENE